MADTLFQIALVASMTGVLLFLPWGMFYSIKIATSSRKVVTPTVALVAALTWVPIIIGLVAFAACLWHV